MNICEHIGKMFIVTNGILAARNISNLIEVNTKRGPDFYLSPRSCFMLIKAEKCKTIVNTKCYWRLVGLIGKQLISFTLWDWQILDSLCLLDEWDGELNI